MTLNRYSIHDRKSLVDFRDMGRPTNDDLFSSFVNNFPNLLMAKDLKFITENVVRCNRQGGKTILAMGAHFIKTGLSPILIDAINRGIFQGICMNGAGVIHDTELAICGRTSENVEEGIKDGSFGMEYEVPKFIGRTLKIAKPFNLGFGQAMANAIRNSEFEFKEHSILNAACENNIPVTVHVAIGTDIFHMHPEADGADIGIAAMIDFRKFCTQMLWMDNGVFINFGSAVIIPEVFLKAVSMARNQGFPLEDMITANFDFIRQYRPMNNITGRPVKKGNGINIIGPHEIMFPLLIQMIKERSKI